MSLNSLYDELATATEDYFAPKVVDNIFKSNPFALRLRANAQTLGGGLTINMPMIYKTGSGEWIGEWQTFDAEYEEEVGAAQLDWKIYTTGVVLSALQLLKNADAPTRRFDLAKIKNIVAAKRCAHNLGQAVFDLNDGALDAKAVDSLDLAVSDSTETGTTYAGITRTGSGDVAVWDANISSASALTLEALQDLWGDCEEGDESPDFNVTCQANFNRYWNLLTPMQRLGSDLMGKAGFRSLQFNGTPVVVDSHVSSVAGGGSYDYWYMLNMAHVILRPHRLAFYKFMRSVMPWNQWVALGRYFFVGNLCVDAPRYQGKAKFTS